MRDLYLEQLRNRQPSKRSRHGGAFDLLVVVAVAAAVMIRTPVGGLVERVFDALLGHEADHPSLLAYFDTGPPPEIAVLAEEAAVLPDVPPAPDGGLPEPYRTAAAAALPNKLPAAARAVLDAMEVEPTGDPRLAVLDAIYEGDPEAALEDYAVGSAQRTRAISRAWAAGEPSPTRLSGHRRYLPAEAQRTVDRYVAGTLAIATALDIAWPIEGSHRVSSGYGDRIHPVLKTKRFHNGVDISVPIGTPVLAAQRGKVVKASNDKVNGNYLVIDHGHGVRTSYCHLDSLSVKAGAIVEREQVIAASGNTGRSTGPHLHFVVRMGKNTVDPARFRQEPDGT